MIDPIYFDARYVRVGQHDGISRFSAGLIDALSQRTKVVAIIYDEAQLQKLPTDIEYVKLSDPTNPFAEFFIAMKLNSLGAKLVFSPMQTMGTWFRKYRLVLTLHDLIYYSHPTPPLSFPWLIRLGWRLFHMTYIPQRLLLNRADAIATVSQTTKSLIVKHRLTSKPVFVTYNAGTGIISPKRSKPTKALVYMGSFMDYKNVESLIDGMAELPEFELHLLSKISPKRKQEFIERANSHAQRIIFHNGVSDDEYHAFLSKCFALVSASLDEGFGIPVIEAMEQGTPVIISQIPIFEEIGGKAASYFEPTNPAEFAKRVRELESTSNWSSASKNSRAQAQKFDWGNSADVLLERLQNL